MRRHLPTLDRLRALAEVARTGGFSAAAASLGLTQPAVSNQIRQLESELGARLLERTGRRARPTPEGEILIAAASLAAAGLETALDEIARRRAEVAGTLVLATGSTATRHLLPPVAAGLRARHPAIELRVLTGNTADLVKGVVDGSTDLGLLTGPIRAPRGGPRLVTRFFFRDRLVCVAPPGEMPRLGAIRPRDLAGRQLVLYDRGGSIRRAVDGWLAPVRDRVRVTDIGSAEAQAAFVRAGFGWSIISEVVAREDAAAGRLDLLGLSPALSRDLVLAARRPRGAAGRRGGTRRLRGAGPSRIGRLRAAPLPARYGRQCRP